MNMMAKGIYKNGKVELLENLVIDEGKEVTVLLSSADKSNTDFNILLNQQEAIKKYWADEENLYGEI